MSSGLPRPGTTPQSIIESLRRTVEAVEQLQGSKDQPERSIRLRELTTAGLLTLVGSVPVRSDKRTLLLANAQLQASIAVVPGTRYFVVAESLTPQMPASPQIGDIVSFVSAINGGVTTFSVNPNGRRIMGSDAIVTSWTGDFAVTYVYFDSTRGWREA